MKTKHILYLLLAVFVGTATSCSDFFDQDSDHVTFTDDFRLDNPRDTIYALTGIMSKLSALGDRTILLGEARGDLVSVTTAANADLRAVANFDVNDSNRYNSPKDYYAVINNCNLYISLCDTALSDTHTSNNSVSGKVFMKEYAAVKAFRAWTYLQLVLNYGRVPFVTEPILTKEASEATYPMKDIQEVCTWLINDIAPLAGERRPGLGTIGVIDSRLLYFPIYFLLGDLNLWAGNYQEAALAYYRFLNTENGSAATRPIGLTYYGWANTTWTSFDQAGDWRGQFSREGWWGATGQELITMIPGDSVPSQDNYSQLRNIFNSTSDNDYKPSLVPSQSLRTLSASQVNCVLTPTYDVVYAPSGLSDERAGDLRLMFAWNHSNRTINSNRVEYQTIWKYQTQNIHIYRRVMAYLRMAEALNRAGYPYFAYEILARGVNNQVLADYVLPYCTTQADSAFVNQFNFPYTATSGYIVYDPRVNSSSSYINTIGIHSRGSGWAMENAYYQMPYPEFDPADTVLTAKEYLEKIKSYQIEKVEDMIVDEGALECAFEGTRYYDLLRVALRRGDLDYLASRVATRGGADAEDTALRSKLQSMQNLFLHYQGKIGY